MPRTLAEIQDQLRLFEELAGLISGTFTNQQATQKIAEQKKALEDERAMLSDAAARAARASGAPAAGPAAGGSSADAARDIARAAAASTAPAAIYRRQPKPKAIAPARGQASEVPIWEHQLMHDLASRAGDLSAARAEQRYPGLTPEEWNRQKRAIESDDRFKAPFDAIKVDVAEGIDPVPLSPREIIQAQQNANFASELFKSAVGRRPEVYELRDFQQVLRQDYPVERLVTPDTTRDELEAPLSRDEAVAVIERARLPQEIAQAQKLASNLALPNATHKEAERLIRESVGNTKFRADQRGRQLSELGAEDIKLQVAPDLTQARLDPIDTMGRYQNAYEREVAESLREQAEADWAERIAPSISGAYAIMGNTRSGAHAAALERAQLKHARELRGELAKLKAHGFESAHAAAKGQQDAALNRAQVTGHVGKAQQEHLARAAELAIRDAATTKAQELLSADAVGKLAAAQMQQEQAEMNERIKTAERPLDMEEHALAFERAMHSGQMLPRAPSAVPQSPPSAINPYSAAAGVLGTMYGLQQPQQPGGMAHGGHAKRKFAGGGLIPSWQELSKQVSSDKYAPNREKIAEDLQKYSSPFNATQNWASHVGSQLLQNLTGSPLAAMGKGSELAHADRLKYQQHAYDQSRLDKIQAEKIYEKMDESLRNQKHFLADYEAKRGDLEIKKMGHLETMRHHGAIEGYNKEKLALKKGAHNAMMQEGDDPAQSAARKFMAASPKQQEMINEAFTGLKEARKLKGYAASLKETTQKLNTGPILGSMPKSLASLLGVGEMEELDKLDQLRDEMALSMNAQQKSKNAETFKAIQRIKGAPTNTPARNLEAAESVNKTASADEREYLSLLRRLNWTDEEIESQLLDKESKKESKTDNVNNEEKELLAKKEALMAELAAAGGS
jgi:hypothetical protein